MNIQMLKDYFQEFIDGKQHKIMFLNRKKDMFEEFKVIDAINLLEEKDKEIERLNNKIQDLQADYGNKAQVERDLLKEENKKYNKWIESLNKDNHRLNNIIKEVREYIEEMQVYDYEFNEYVVQVKELLEILDKGDKGKIIEEEPRDIEVCGSLFTKNEYDKLAGIKKDKKIEKVPIYVLCDYDFKNKDDNNNLIATNIIDKAFEEFAYKINKIIDYLEENK